MPAKIKITISIVALALAVAVFLVDQFVVGDAVNPLTKWIALALGPLMVLAIWVFPEAKKNDVKEIRAANASRK